MTAEECKAVILALNQYSRDLSEGAANLDVSGIPSMLGRAFCKMIAERVKQDADAYERKCSQNSANRRKRPSTDDDDSKRPSTDDDDGRQIKQNIMKQSKTQSKEAEEDLSDDNASTADDDIFDQIADHQRADDLIRRYQLPDGDISREALLEDAERIGWPGLEEALQAASRSNSRQRLSVNFYRRFLNNIPTTSGGEWLAIENL